MKNKRFLWYCTVLIMTLIGCGGGGGGDDAFSLVGVPTVGTFAAVDNPANPTVGLVVTSTVNADQTAFNVTGKAVNSTGDTWVLAGTMTRAGVLQINGTGVAEVVPPVGSLVVTPPPPANMTITGTMTAATVNFAIPVQVTFEKALPLPPTSPLVTKFTLASDPGVTTPNVQEQHAAASLIVKADGKITGALVHTGVTGLNANPLLAAPILGCRFAKIDGIIKSDGTFIGIAGGNAASGLALNSRAPLTYPSGPSGTIFTGTVAANGLTATVNMRTRPLAGIVTIPRFSMVKAVNTQAGVLVGTHVGDPGGPGPIVLGVNQDSTTFGFMKVETPGPGGGGGPRRPHVETSFVGTVGAGGAFAPGTIPIPPSAPVVLTSGLVGVNDEGNPLLQPTTLSGSITAGVAVGRWEAAAEAVLGSGVFALVTTGGEFFTATMVQ